MWYRQAINSVVVNPSGQLGNVFPGIKPKKFDVDNDVRFKVTQDYKTNEYTITAYHVNGRILGFIIFRAPDYADTAQVKQLYLVEYPTKREDPLNPEEEVLGDPLNKQDRFKSDMIEDLSNSGYSADESSITIIRWGIGQALFREAKKFIQNYRPDVKYIKGYITSKEAFKSRNSVFGLPYIAEDPEELLNYRITEETHPKEREELTQKMTDELLESEFDSVGLTYFNPDSYLVTHKIDRIPYESTELYKKGPKIPMLPKTEENNTPQLKLDI